MIATEGAAPRRNAHSSSFAAEKLKAPTVRAARKIGLGKSKTPEVWLNGLLIVAGIAALVLWARTMLEMFSELVELMP